MKMHGKLVVFFVSLALVAYGCGKDESSGDKSGSGASAGSAAKAAGSGSADGTGASAKTEPDDSAVGTGLKAPEAKLSKGKFAKADVPSGLEALGKVTGGLRFTDKNGENWVVFSKKRNTKGDVQNEFLYAQHWALGAGGAADARELRVIRDKVEDCEFDLTLAIDKKSVDVTDLDGDGYGEVNFGYEQTCTSDVSPSGYKYLMLENGEKYIIRGSTKLYMPKEMNEDPMGGERKIDKSFKDGPKEFLDHAKKRWKKLTVRRM